ncbi:MAG TPA: hypothetical protein PK957_03430 [Candidatus Dojkabacteria bacterium]|nr:hypothetical protein [Candidatus Dojkabacteria bacterium]HQF36840.1 hypothetical protein [Candidatus Dojkabacteria bacterium]
MNKEKIEAVTLMESLIYIALFGIIFVVLIKLFLVNYEGFNDVSKTVNINRNLVYIVNHTSEVVENCGASFTLVSSDFSTNLDSISFSCEESQFGYRIENGNILFNRNGIENRININNSRIVGFNIVPSYDKYDELSSIQITYELASLDGEIKRDFSKLYNLKY